MLLDLFTLETPRNSAQGDRGCPNTSARSLAYLRVFEERAGWAVSLQGEVVWERGARLRAPWVPAGLLSSRALLHGAHLLLCFLLQRRCDHATLSPTSPSGSCHFPRQSPHRDHRCSQRSHTPLRTQTDTAPSSLPFQVPTARLYHYYITGRFLGGPEHGLRSILVTAQRARLAWSGLLLKQKWPGLQRTLA